MGLSFAVPIKLAMQVAEQLKETGEVTRGWLGVMIQNVNQELAESFDIEQASGALVSQILPDSPAAEAGIEVGDIIIRYGDELVEESSELPRMIGVTAVGKTVDLLVVRKGEPLQLKATIARLEVEEEITTIDERRADLLNMAVSELSDEQRRILNLDQRGVLVTEVDDGLAANAGIYPYDVILSVNYEDVTGTQQFIELIGGLPLGKAVPLLVLREDETIFLPLKLAGKE
jgi:serine protease Do